MRCPVHAKLKSKTCKVCNKDVAYYLYPWGGVCIKCVYAYDDFLYFRASTLPININIEDTKTGKVIGL